jgi:hypothetical protein
LIPNLHLTQSEPRKIDAMCTPDPSEEATQSPRGSHSNTVHKRPHHHSACYMSWAYEPEVLERQQHWLACSQYLPTDACTRWRRGGRRNADCQLDNAASGCSPGGVMSLLRHMATMDTLAALGWSICATGAGAASHVKAPARLVAQHQNPAKLRTVLALLSHGYLPYSVASDSKLLEASRGLGSGGPAASRHRSQQRARGR